MTNTTAANGKEAAYHGVPAEDDYGYAQALRVGSMIYLSGQLSQDDKGAMIAPAALDENGKPADFSMMAEQMRVAYANAATILAQFGATLDHVVEERLYVLDLDEAFTVAREVRKEAYAKARPQCDSILIGVSSLAYPGQLIEIVFKAVLPTALGHVAPASLAALLDAEGVLASGNLSQQDLQVIRLLVSTKAGCDVSVAAHSFAGEMVGLPLDALRAIRAGQPTGDAKHNALVRFVTCLQTTSGPIRPDEFTAIRATGYADIQLAEISLAIALTTFANTFNRINGTDVDCSTVE